MSHNYTDFEVAAYTRGQESCAEEMSALKSDRDAARAEVARLKGLLREASIALDDAVEWLWRDEETVMSSRVRQLNGRINAALAEAPAAKEGYE